MRHIDTWGRLFHHPPGRQEAGCRRKFLHVRVSPNFGPRCRLLESAHATSRRDTRVHPSWVNRGIRSRAPFSGPSVNERERCSVATHQHTLPHDDLAHRSDETQGLLSDQSQQLEQVLDVHCRKCGCLCARSRRRGLRDWLLRFMALHPWRCQTCRARFYFRRRR